MSALAKVLAGTGPQHRFEFEGKVWPCRLIDWDMKLELELNLYNVRLKALEPLRKLMDPGAYQARLDAVTAKYENGDYGLEAPEGQVYYLGDIQKDDPPAVRKRKEAKRLPGLLHMAGLIFGMDPKTMTRCLKTKGAEANTLLSLIVRESFVTEGEAEEGESPTDPSVESPDPNA